MVFEPEQLLRETGGSSLGTLQTSLAAKHISTDTRLLKSQDAFFALEGPHFDGHDFLEEALKRGATTLVVSDPHRIQQEWLKQANVIVVKDTLRAYGDLARAHRLQFRIPVIAVTGSSGKTTVKELIAHLLSSKFKVLKNRGTENNLVGVPKTIFQIDASHEAVVLELGTSAPGEIERLAEISRPQIGVLTQIGYSHLQGLKNIEGVRQEKSSLIRHVERGGLIVVNGEDPLLFKIESGVHRVLRMGLHEKDMDFWANVFSGDEHRTIFQLNSGQKIESPLLGRHNIINVLLAMQCAMALGVEIEKMQEALLSFKAVPGRLAVKKIDGILFLDDTYNSNPTSMGAALETLRSFSAKRKGLVCGDMLELGEDAQALHQSIGTASAGLGLQFLIVVGELSRILGEAAIRAGMPSSKVFFAKDNAEAGKLTQQQVHAGDAVLVKGSRGMQMEKVFECFTSCSTR